MVVVGANHVIEGLDDAMADMGIGEEKSIEIPAEKAFGPRNPKLITTVPLREFSKQGIMPRPGMRLEIGESWATVKNVSSGRVTLDFNHTLAGRTLIYDLKVLREVSDAKEQLSGLIDLHFRTFEFKNSNIEIDEEGNAKLNIPGIKKEVCDAIKAILEEEAGKYIPEIKSIEVSS